MYERELVTMNDGGTISLDWFADSNDFDTFQPTTPIVLVMHGLTGRPFHPHPILKRPFRRQS